MAARNTDIFLTTGAAVLLTDGAVSACRVQILPTSGGRGVILQATTNSTPPSSPSGGVRLDPGEILAADMTLAQLFGGIGPSEMYLWGFAVAPCTVSVSHA